MDGTCRFHAAFVDEQVLPDVSENNIPDFARRTALFQRNNRATEQSAVGFL